MRPVSSVVFPEKKIRFVFCFISSTQLGMISRVFLYAGANQPIAITQQESEHIMLFFKI